jgi:uncharacterized membrane protein
MTLKETYRYIRNDPEVASALMFVILGAIFIVFGILTSVAALLGPSFVEDLPFWFHGADVLIVFFIGLSMLSLGSLVGSVAALEMARRLMIIGWFGCSSGVMKRPDPGLRLADTLFVRD